MKAKTGDNSKEIELKLTVNRTSWIRVQSFESSMPDDRHYVVAVDRQGNGIVRFGDGKKGRRPPAGSNITATYRFGAGVAGNQKKRQTIICFSLD